uniref:RRP15-like protein n=1 Tax=Strongyloides stercoralis TaxID=6248 RepID=A0AAF5I1Z4_STRER
MSLKRKAAEIEIEEEEEYNGVSSDKKNNLSSDDEVMDDNFDSDDEVVENKDDINEIESDELEALSSDDEKVEKKSSSNVDDDSEDSAQYDEDESEEEMSSEEEEGVIPNANMKKEKLKVVHFDSVKTIKKREKAAKRLTSRQLIEKKKEKMAHLKMGMVKPDYAKDRTKERSLARIASFGVATLFNQVLEYRKRIREDEITKKEVKNMDISKKYQAQLDSLPRTANRFTIKNIKKEEV